MIYFVTAREVGRVKIGISAAPVHRLTKMRSDSPVTVSLERVCDGGYIEEQALHERFASARAHGEWFSLTPEIEAHMAGLPEGPAVLPAKRKKTLGAKIAERVGISRGYASMILAGKRKPPVPLALQIFKHTGWKHPAYSDVDDADLLALAVKMPWKRAA